LIFEVLVAIILARRVCCLVARPLADALADHTRHAVTGHENLGVAITITNSDSKGDCRRQVGMRLSRS
jgi:hypothetical protein